MTYFKRTNVKLFRKQRTESTPDASYWKQLGAPVLIKEFGPIDYIDFSPADPHYFAVTSSVHVQIYNPITKQVAKNISNFKETAYGATFRKDGELICAGGEESVVRLFEVASKTPLRIFKGHRSAVHRCFFTKDKVHIASFSDDQTVKLWDIASETEVTQFSEHTDYVRAGSTSPVSQDIMLSGGYDNTVRMYDSRTQKSVFQVDHGAPVESVMFLPSGGVFLSAGGTEIRVWDAFSGGRMLAKISSHHKTITCLCLASKNTKFCSGSLDRHVKIYDIATYRAVHTLDYPNSILSLGVSADDNDVVVGMVDGLVSVATREKRDVNKQEQKQVKSSYRYAADKPKSSSTDVLITDGLPTKGISRTDFSLQKFRYTKSLDQALLPYIVNKTPEVTVAVLVDLIRRKGLKQSLAGRDEKSLVTLLRFLIRYVTDQRFTRILIDVTNTILDVYDDTPFSEPVMALVTKLAFVLREEEQATEDLSSLQGAMQMLLAASSVGDGNIDSRQTESTNHLQPSMQAQKLLTINLT